MTGENDTETFWLEQANRMAHFETILHASETNLSVFFWIFHITSSNCSFSQSLQHFFSVRSSITWRSTNLLVNSRRIIPYFRFKTFRERYNSEITWRNTFLFPFLSKDKWLDFSYSKNIARHALIRIKWRSLVDASELSIRGSTRSLNLSGHSK